MIDMIKEWYSRHFSNPQVVILALLLVLGFSIIIFYGEMLLPLLISIVVAYLLESAVQKLQRIGVSRNPAAYLVFILFLILVVVSLVSLIPLLSEQMAQFFTELPKMISATQRALMRLPESYPGVVSQDQIRELMIAIRAEIGDVGQKVLSFSLTSLQNLITWAVYLLLIIILVFFFLKDKRKIQDWVISYLPKDRALVKEVWIEMDMQIGNYVRGKILEIIVVGVATWVVFALMGMNYAILLGLLVGLSVLVPYVGATVVTIPVALVAFFQWGWSTEFFYLMLGYGIVQALDGNVLVPLLFSEAVNLHPVAIIAAIIVFGGLWGFWGVFFAIPLATLVKAVLNAWPRGGLAGST
ncbi:MAG: AI-2E family transporter [Gammaproteobacteria bacterium]|nr:AI-2E family transporter [Gammaproteobacteria bacterium]